MRLPQPFAHRFLLNNCAPSSTPRASGLAAGPELHLTWSFCALCRVPNDDTPIAPFSLGLRLYVRRVLQRCMDNETLVR